MTRLRNGKDTETNQNKEKRFLYWMFRISNHTFDPFHEDSWWRMVKDNKAVQLVGSELWQEPDDDSELQTYSLLCFTD